MRERDCCFIVADKNMEAVVRSVFGDAAFPDRLGCGSFAFEPERDLVLAAGLHNVGMYVRGHTLASGFRRSHRHLVMMLDVAWDGSPGRDEIVASMSKHLTDVGWDASRAIVVAIDPELENWIWSTSPQVAKVFGYADQQPLRVWLEQLDLWPVGVTKPPVPKAAVQRTLQHTGKARSPALYGRLVRTMPLKGCRDEAFVELRDTLRRWFPPRL